MAIDERLTPDVEAVVRAAKRDAEGLAQAEYARTFASLTHESERYLAGEQIHLPAAIERLIEKAIAVGRESTWGRNPPCQQCQGPHLSDTSLPSEVWNKIAEPWEYLCALCIDERLVKAGLTCNEAEFYFVGDALSSKLYAEPSHGDIAHWIRQGKAAGRVEALREVCKRHVSGGDHWPSLCPDCIALMKAEAALETPEP